MILENPREIDKFFDNFACLRHQESIETLLQCVKFSDEHDLESLNALISDFVSRFIDYSFKWLKQLCTILRSILVLKILQYSIRTQAKYCLFVYSTQCSSYKRRWWQNCQIEINIIEISGFWIPFKTHRSSFKNDLMFVFPQNISKKIQKSKFIL